jgi:two-component system sensor histidine kinase BaeS
MTGPGSARPVHALVVDDEEHLARLVADYLARNGFTAQIALDGERALELAREHPPDVVILNLMLPGIDGVEVCRQLRTFTDAYVIMLTARAEEVDKLIGLAVGADDYLTKPFSPRELIARVKAMLRRPRGPQPGGRGGPVRQFGDLTIDPAAREALIGGGPVELTRLEFDLLDTLSAQPRVAFSRRQLIEHVWGEDWFGDEHLVVTAQLLAIGAGAITFLLVALAAGPPLFRTHVRQALGTVSPALSRHLDDAFAAAAGIAIGVAAAAALLTAVAVSLLITRRLSRPIHDLSTAAARVAAGDYAARVTPPGLGPELDSLTGGFNVMAAALQNTEATRRRLLADAAHELRTPLATLDAYLEGLADGVRAPTQQTWDVLASQTARLRRLADDIALVSRAEEHQLPLRKAAISVNDLVTTAAQAARPSYTNRGVQLTTQLAPELPNLTADPDRLAQVLAGLLSNALRHTPPGGQVTISTQIAGPHLEITVADTGQGITADHLPHIFERFYRADTARDRAHGGSGIGLTIARALITAHGGTLTAASDGPGTGTRFTITLPGSVNSG